MCDISSCTQFYVYATQSLLIFLNKLSFLIGRFPEGSLYTNTNDEGWKMIRVGDDPLGFGEFELNIHYFHDLHPSGSF